MIRKVANERVLELIEHYGTTSNSLLPIEFFFYTDRQDDASNLAIDLYKLGYEIYSVEEPGTDLNKWSVIGTTPKMKPDDDAITEWTDKMELLAEEHNAEFDGWGTLIDEDEDL